ncbi:hypothetical protein [Flavobacterium laiguense]|uniref:Uncharacterized protein n=1 Tax=Flavobacterium laiguense TaxID=2169409 RepID=A0A2U1JKR7_9FLAO|nr:hypothetical protein [Flavobacterium laiguense]PWA05473.1 hypothetical protein DB891_17030 [Flavobacterium laiguense]
MKVISKEKVVLVNDRQGLLEEHIQIEITVERKDSVSKTYTIKTVDSIVLNKGTENESTMSYFNRSGQVQEKIYTKTYAEFDEQKEILLSYFPSELTGSELDDHLLQMGLLYNLGTDPIYGLKGDQWEPK